MYLGIDCGTQGTKALLVDDQGVAIGRGYAPHALIERATGAREQDPQWWLDAVRDSVRQAVAGHDHDGSTVLALGVSGQQHGLVVLDEEYRVIRPAKLWNDTETTPQNEELIRRFGGKEIFFERFGIVPLTGYTVSKLLWLKEQEPENFERIRHILLPHEYINFWLTGEICAEYGDASGTGYFDVRTRSWIKEVLDEIDGGTGLLFKALPRLIHAEEMVGPVRAEIAAQLGVTSSCLVSSGGGDNMMGAIGTGNVAEGVVTLSLGTSGTVFSFRNQTAVDPSGNIAPFCSSSGGWLPLVCTMNVTNVVTQTVQLLGSEIKEIDPALQGTEPGAGGITFIPFLNGERTPDLPQAHGTLLGISSSNFTHNNLIRATVEGVTFGLLNGLKRILEQERPTRILVIGGGARSAQWRQLIADATGIAVEVPLEQEAGCLGACIQAKYAYLHTSGKPESFESLTSACFRIDETKAAAPCPDKLASYEAAHALYEAHLKNLYGEAAS
ncbi:MAG TPA: xylulokinase [Granulicella sp.]